MGLFDRVSRVVRSNLNAAVSSAEDPEKILEQAIIDMQEDLVQMRQAVAKANPAPNNSSTSQGRRSAVIQTINREPRPSPAGRANSQPESSTSFNH